MSVLTRFQTAAGRIKHDAITVYYVARDPRTPLHIRLIAFGIAAYAFSPIDLIPDFMGALIGLMVVVLGGMLARAKLTRRNDGNGHVRGNQTVD